MAINNNRIRCTATIDGSGVINTVAAVSGYQLPANLWAGGAMASGTVGTHQYVLEDGSGQWELGVVVTTGAFVSTRTVIQSNANAGAGFSNGATGLTLSIVSDDMGSWACHRQNLTDSPPSASGSGLAAGASAEAADTSMAIGKGAKARGAYAIAIGETAGGAGLQDNSTSLGAFSVAGAANSTAIGAGATATLPKEICLGEALISIIPVSGIHTGTSSLVDATGSLMDFRDHAVGYLAVKATIRVEDDANPDLPAYVKAFTSEYFLYVDSGGTLTVLGTPTITATYTGASVGTTVMTIDTVRGTPKISYTGASGTGNSKGTLFVTRT